MTSVVRVENSFQFTVRASVQDAFPLFGGWGERAWAGDSWEPRFLWPQPPKDEPGEVFTVGDGEERSIWINTVFDIGTRRIQYVYVMPEVQAVVIDLCLVEDDAGACTAVSVVYRRTSLHPDMNERITQLGQRDRVSGPEWEASVNAFLVAHS